MNNKKIIYCPSKRECYIHAVKLGENKDKLQLS